MTTKEDLEEINSIIQDDLKYSNWMYNEVGGERLLQYANYVFLQSCAKWFVCNALEMFSKISLLRKRCIELGDLKGFTP